MSAEGRTKGPCLPASRQPRTAAPTPWAAPTGPGRDGGPSAVTVSQTAWQKKRMAGERWGKGARSWNNSEFLYSKQKVVGFLIIYSEEVLALKISINLVTFKKRKVALF